MNPNIPMETPQSPVQKPIQTTPPVEDHGLHLKKYLWILTFIFMIAVASASYILGRNQLTKTSTGQSPSPILTNQTTNYFNIPELGIRFKTTDDIKDLVYSAPATNGQVGIHFSTQSLIKAGEKETIASVNYCTPEHDPIGSLSKVYKSSLIDNDPNQPWWNTTSGLNAATKDRIESNGVVIKATAKEFSDFYILFVTPQAGCGKSQTTNQLQTNILKALENAIPTIELTSANQTSAWKTYTNTINKYTIKVPTDWTVQEGAGVFIGGNGEVIFIPPGEVTMGIGYTEIAITAFTSKSDRYALYTDSQFQEWLNKPISDGANQRLYKSENIVIDGNQGVIFISRTLPGDRTEAYYSEVAWIRKNGINYYIELGGLEEKVMTNLGIFKEALSTFKFTY